MPRFRSPTGLEIRRWISWPGPRPENEGERVAWPTSTDTSSRLQLPLFSSPTERGTSTIRLSRLSRAYLSSFLLFSSPLSLLILLSFFFLSSRPRRNFLFDATREPPTRRWLHRLSRNSVTLQPRERSSFPRACFCCVGNSVKSHLLRGVGGFSQSTSHPWKWLLKETFMVEKLVDYLVWGRKVNIWYLFVCLGFIINLKYNSHIFVWLVLF